MTDEHDPGALEAIALDHEVDPVEDRLRAVLYEEGLDAILLCGADLVGWLTGYFRYGSGASAALLQPGRPIRLLVPSFEVALAEVATATRHVDVRPSTQRGFGMLADPVPDLREALLDLPDVASYTRWAAGGASWLVGDDSLGEVVDGSSYVSRLRLVKDPVERAAIAHAGSLCWVAQEAVAAALEGPTSELDLFTLARLTGERRHGQPVDFYADVVAGTASGDVGAPIAVPGPRVIEEGEGVIVDLVFGASGYWGDVTWTHVSGANDEVESIRERLVSVMEAVATELVPGQRCSAIYASMARRIDEAVAGSDFPHHGGHGIGLAGYEAPFITPWDDTELTEGMVLAIEPGCYFPRRVGVRVERDYVVTARGGQELPGRPATMGTGHGA
jgi:Xaa-Pro aminopeptidase